MHTVSELSTVVSVWTVIHIRYSIGYKNHCAWQEIHTVTSRLVSSVACVWVIEWCCVYVYVSCVGCGCYCCVWVVVGCCVIVWVVVWCCVIVWVVVCWQAVITSALADRFCPTHHIFTPTASV